MYKYVMLALLLAGMASASEAATTPKDNHGITVPTLDVIGVSTCRVNSSTGTTALLCASGAQIVYGVSVSSDANANYMVFRDSATANTTSAVAKVQWNDDTAEEPVGTHEYNWSRPVKFTNGISVNLNAAAPTGTQSEWIIYYRSGDSEN